MAVPCGDERDHKFAKHFNIPITNIIGEHYNGEEANPTKDAILENTDFINGMVMRDAIEVVIKKLEEVRIGVRKVNYKMRDAALVVNGIGVNLSLWSKGNDIAYPMDEKDLPLELPPWNEFKSAGTGEGPLANITEWVYISEHEKRDTNTMPGYAGQRGIFCDIWIRIMIKSFANRKAFDYWGQVDVYIGGTEHAVGHLLYSRMWTKVLHDLGYLKFDEPFRKLINQGMIQVIPGLFIASETPTGLFLTD